MKTILFLALLSAGSFGLRAGEPRQAITPHIAPTIKFTENNGQWDQQILLRATLPGGAMFIERDALVFNFYDRQKLRDLHTGGLVTGRCRDFAVKGHAYKVVFENGSGHALLQKMQMGESYENFFIGNDPSKWRGRVRNYEQVWLRGLYDGIDYELLAATAGAKYNFHVSEGADPAQIKMRFEGVDDIFVRNGKLYVRTSVNEVIEEQPYAYQLVKGAIKQVKCKFRLEGNVVSFILPEGYDKKATLVIDPVLVFSAQIGSAADNFGMSATFDSAGNLYSAGVVFSSGYPYVTGSYDNSFNNTQEYGRTDVFVTKYNATGNALIYSTYLGGSSSEVVSSMIVDRAGNLCLYGATGSTNFPVTTGAADPTFNGGNNIGFITNGSVFLNGSDIFVSKLNSGGTALLASTFFGGGDNDGMNYLGGLTNTTYNLFPATGTATTNICAYDSLFTNYGDQYRGEIGLDSLDNIYVFSSTRSSNLPVVGGFDNTLGGKQDAVVAKFNGNLTSLLYSTFLGGSQIDCGNGMYVGPAGDIYLTGGTCSNDLPGSSGASSASYNGGKCDGFLSSISSAGNLVRTTYIGTSSYDNSFFVRCSKTGEPYVYGQSLGNMPVLPRGSQPVYSVSNTHQFLACYNSGLTAKLMSTVFGSNTNTIDVSPSAFAIDDCTSNIYMSGWGGGLLSPNTASLSNMPLASPVQSTTNGYDFYLIALKADATSLLFGSYFGGSSSREHVDGGTSRIDTKGVLYQSVCAGCAGNQDFPWTTGAWPCPNATSCPTLNPSGNCNNGVFKMNFDFHTDVDTSYASVTTTCSPVTVTLTNSLQGTSYLWDLGNGDTTSVIPSPVLTFTSAGIHTVSLMVRDDAQLCASEDLIITSYSVFAAIQVSASVNPTMICMNEVALISAQGANSYSWTGAANSTASTFTFSSSQPQSYTFQVAGSATNGCQDGKSVVLVVDECAGVNDLSEMTTLNIYPNPNEGTFSITAGHAVKLVLVNELGQVIRVISLDSSNQFQSNVSGLTAGVYLLQWNEAGVKSGRKLVVTR